MPKITGYRYTVTGMRGFPIDMLRYDCAWPCDSENVIEIAACRCDTEWYYSNRRVTLMSQRKPTPDRWASFGWTIEKIEAMTK